MAHDRKRRTALGTILTILCTLSAGTSARGQLSADPYKPYNAEYEQYVYPSYPGELGVTPNQSLLQGRGGSARSYQRFLEEEEEMDRASSSFSTAPGRRGIGVPYYRAYRDYDKAYNRVYAPNKEADASYLANVRARDDLYARYLAAKDPKKRAALLKEYQDVHRRALSALGQGRNTASRRPRPSGGEAGTPPRPPIPGTTERRSGRSAGTGGRSRAGSSPNPSNTDVLNRSESRERASRPRPEPPPLPTRRPAVDTAP